MATAATAKYEIRLENKTKRAFKAIGRSLKKVTRAIFSMKAGFISAAGIAGLGYLIKRSMDATDEMAKMSRAVGVSVEQLQGLRHAAALGGLEAKQLDKAVQKLAINMADMSRGVGLAKDVFEKHNISVKNADGSLRTVMEVMADVADVTAGMTNETEKADLAYKLFGARGAKMINMLNGGSEAMKEAMKEAEKLGLVMSAETAKGVEDANDSITRLKGYLTSTFTRAVAAVAPVIRTVTDAMQDWIEMKLDSTEGGMGAIAESIANQIVIATITILQSFENMANGMIKWKNKIADTFGFKSEINQLAEDIGEGERILNAYTMGDPFALDEFGERVQVYKNQLKDLGGAIKAFFSGQENLSKQQNMDAMLQAIDAMKERFNELEDAGEKMTTKLSFQEIIYQLRQLKKMFVSTDIEGEMNDGSAAVKNLDKSYKDLNTTLSETASTYTLIGEHMDNNLADSHSYFDSMKAGFESYYDTVKNGTLSIASITTKFMHSTEDAIVNMIMGIKTDWKALARSIFADLARMYVRKNIVVPMAKMMGFASGGRPPVGRPSIVGERGAELFVPDSAGKIIPNNQLGGQTINVTYSPQVNALDPRTAGIVIAENAPTVVAVVRDAFNRNGRVAGI